MVMTDPLADMLTRIRNTQLRGKNIILVPVSNLRKCVLDVLVDEGFIRSYKVVKSSSIKHEFKVELKYFEGKPVIQEIKRISKPGRRVYSSVKNITPVYNGLGISILSTSKGIMPDWKARKKNVGGEILCQLF